MFNILDTLKEIRQQAEQRLHDITDKATLEQVRLAFLGKKGQLTDLLKQMGSVAAEQRPAIGSAVNEVRSFIEGKIKDLEQHLGERELNTKLQSEKIDVTMPVKRENIGKVHPMIATMNEAISIFRDMGFTVVQGPEIETDYFNFEALNVPKNHPARDMQDTFYITENVLLRTQTSSMQIRHMKEHTLPLKIVAPGRTYRDEQIDATHGAIFNQMECLLVDKGITLGDLKGTLDIFCKRMFGEKTKTRFRPSFFPFTEPSAEVDITCHACGGKGCRICKGEGFIELLGSGMVHPNVLRECDIDPEVYSGFAFGVGLERITMCRYFIDDLRLFYENDLRFLKQF